MVDVIEEYLRVNRLTVQKVLEYVDEYSLYSHYIGVELELYTKYSSPLRDGDADPSFVLYESKYKEDYIMFKDMATGQYGGVFKFLTLLLDTDLQSVLQQINADFGLGFDGGSTTCVVAKKVTKLKVVKHSTKMWITARESSEEFLSFWKKLDISIRVQNMYFAKDTVLIHYENADYNIKVTPKSLCISYEIKGHYKTYQPYGERKYKFRNDFPTGYVEGAVQMKFEKDYALISKASKENMFFREHFDIDSVAGTSENTMISPHFMVKYLKNKFKRVYIMLDNDEAGVKAQAKYVAMYPWLIPVLAPKVGGSTDITDWYTFMKTLGRQEEVLNYIRQTIN